MPISLGTGDREYNAYPSDGQSWFFVALSDNNTNSGKLTVALQGKNQNMILISHIFFWK